MKENIILEIFNKAFKDATSLSINLLEDRMIKLNDLIISSEDDFQSWDPRVLTSLTNLEIKQTEWRWHIYRFYISSDYKQNSIQTRTPLIIQG